VYWLSPAAGGVVKSDVSWRVLIYRTATDMTDARRAWQRFRQDVGTLTPGSDHDAVVSRTRAPEASGG
jgi:hypothetical protein